MNETFILYALFLIFYWINVFSGRFRQVLFFIWGTKIVVPSCITQVVILYRNNCMGISLGGPTVVVLDD